nr:MerR family DNA-binding protein [Sedimentitalea sp. CY04]
MSYLAICRRYRSKRRFAVVTIGEAARRSGVGIELIRYYERTGVVAGPERSQSGRRQYQSVEIHALRFIRRCRDLGFSLAEAKSLLGLASSERLACADAQSLGQHHLENIRTKISDLQQMETAMVQLMRPCDAGKQECSMLDTLLEGPESEWPPQDK